MAEIVLGVGSLGFLDVSNKAEVELNRLGGGA